MTTPPRDNCYDPALPGVPKKTAFQAAMAVRCLGRMLQFPPLHPQATSGENGACLCSPARMRKKRPVFYARKSAPCSKLQKNKKRSLISPSHGT